MYRFFKQWSFLSVALFSFSFSTGVLLAQSQDNPSSNFIAQSSTKVDPQVRQKQAEELVQWLGTQQYDKVIATFDPNLRSVWDTEKLRQQWQEDVTDYAGGYKKILKSRFIDAVNADLVLVTTQFENTTADVIVTFSEDGQVIGINFPKNQSIEEISELFVLSLADKDYAKARGYLHPLLKAEISPQIMQTKWENVLENLGAFQSIVKTQVRQSSDLDIVLMTVRFEKRATTVVLVFDANKQIVNIDYAEAN